MFYFPCTPVHKIVLLFTGKNNEDTNIFWDGEQIIYFHVNRYIIWICQRFVKQYKKKVRKPTSRCPMLTMIFGFKGGGKVLNNLGFKSKVFPGLLADWSVWVGFWTWSTQQGVININFDIWMGRGGVGGYINIPWKIANGRQSSWPLGV
jgi:hypothetical protein